MNYIFGDYLFDNAHSELHHKGQSQSLRFKVRQVLTYLLDHRHRIVSRQELFEQVWHRPLQLKKDSETLDSTIRAVRKSLGERGRLPRYIQTFSQQGYQFIAPVTVSIDGPITVDQNPSPRSALSLPLDQEGHRVRVTILGCRVLGAMAPDMMRRQYMRMQTIITENAQRFHGTMCKAPHPDFIVLFGLDDMLEEHAYAALFAAFAIQETLCGYKIHPSREHDIKLHLGMVLHTGEVVDGHEPVGEPLELMKDLLTHIQTESIALTNQTYGLLRQDVYDKPLATVPREEKPSVPLYEVTGWVRRNPELVIGAQRWRTPYVGRRVELLLLESLLQRADEGRGQVLAIVGEAGIGKSRLLYQFHQALPSQRVNWVTGRCRSYDQIIPYAPFVDILREAFRVQDGDNKYQIHNRLQQGLARLGFDPHLTRNLPVLEGFLIGLDADATPWQTMLYADTRETFEALGELMIAGSQDRPLVLVIENLHWIDKASEACLAFLIDQLARRRVLVITTYRSEYTPPWHAKAYFSQLALDVLSPRETTEMVHQLLGPKQLPPNLLHRIQEYTGGNPLFLEQLSYSLLEQTAQSPHVPGPLASDETRLQIPETIKDLIHTRIDRLSEPVKQTLLTAAVIGNEFDEQLLIEVSPDRQSVKDALKTLQQMDFLHTIRLLPERRYRFKHVLLQDAAYQKLVSPSPRQLHQQIAETFKRFPKEVVESQPEFLASHYTKAELPSQAIPYWLQASQRALERSAHHEARRHLDAGLRLLPKVPDARERASLEANLLLLQARIEYTLGNPSRALTDAEQCLKTAQHLGNAVLLAQSSNLLGRIYFYQGNYRKASALLKDNVVQMQEIGNLREAATAASFAGMAFGFLGEFKDAFDYLNRGIEMAKALHNPFAEAAAVFYRAVTHGLRNAWDESIHDLDMTRRLAGEQDKFRVYLATLYEGVVHTLTGKFERGRTVSEEAIELGNQCGTKLYLAWPKVYLAMCLLALSESAADKAKVLALCRESIALARETHDTFAEALALRTWGERLSLEPEPAVRQESKWLINDALQLQGERLSLEPEPAARQESKQHIEEAIRLQKEEMECQPELARTYMSYANILQSWGEVATAKEYRERATDLFRQMGIGEHKQLTVLAGKITVLGNGEEKLQHIQDVGERLSAIVQRYEGTFVHEGSYPIALFGASAAQEFHALHAVYAALAMQETVSGYNAQCLHKDDRAISLSLAIHTGLAVTNQGNDVSGSTMDLVRELQTRVEPGKITITEATRRAVGEHIRSESVALMNSTEYSEPIGLYHVTGRRYHIPLVRTRKGGRLTPFVGREEELRQLDAHLEKVEEGYGRVVEIVGEAGMGKSRLLHEFRAKLGRRVVWLMGRCQSYGRHTPYFPILDMLRTAFEIEEGDNPFQLHEKVRRALHRLGDANLEAALPFLALLLGLAGPYDSLQHAALKDRKKQIFEILQALAIAGSQQRPHVLVFENLHWSDPTSEECVAFLIENISAVRRRVLILTTHRPGYTPRWADKTFQQIALEALTETDAQKMVEALLVGRDLVHSHLPQLIQEKAEGNPLFIEEWIGALQEHDMLVDHLPDTLQNIVQARLNRLGESTKRTAQLAAVIGRDFSARLLMQLSSRPVEIQDDLERLQHFDLIHEKSQIPEKTYRFKHAVICDGIYQSLLEAQRQQLHGAIGCALEKRLADHTQEQTSALAALVYHYRHSDDRDRAIHFARLAGDAAARLHSWAEAITFYTLALEKAQELPASPETQRIQAEILYWIGRTHYDRGAPLSASTSTEESYAMAVYLGDDKLAAASGHLLGRVQFSLGNYRKASELLKENAEQLRRLEEYIEAATASGFAGLAFAFLGEFDQAFTLLSDSMKLSQQSQNRSRSAEATAYFYRGIAHFVSGKWSETIFDCDTALRILPDDRFRVYVVTLFRGGALIQRGDFEEGSKVLQQSIDLAKELGTTFYLAWPKVFLGMGLLAWGRDEEGTVAALCDEAIRIAEVMGDKYGKALALRTLAEARSRREPMKQREIQQHIEEAIQLQEEMECKPEMARSYRSYASLLHSWDQAKMAEEYLTKAADLFRQIGMIGELTNT